VLGAEAAEYEGGVSEHWNTAQKGSGHYCYCILPTSAECIKYNNNNNIFI